MSGDEFVRVEFVGGGPADGEQRVVLHPAPNPFPVPMSPRNLQPLPDQLDWCTRRGLYRRVEGHYQTIVDTHDRFKQLSQERLLNIFAAAVPQLYVWLGEE